MKETKKLLLLLVTLCTLGFSVTSCKKDDKAKPAIIGVWKWEGVINPEGEPTDPFGEVYLEILEDKTFNEITLYRENNNIYVSNYITGKYNYQDNKFDVTESLFDSGLKVSDVKIVDNNTIEFFITDGDGEGYTIILKRSDVKLAPYIEEYNNYKP